MQAPKSRYKTNFEKPFDSFISSKYQGYSNRISGARKAARNVLVLYPLGFVLFVGLPLAGVTLVTNILYETYPKWFGQFVAQESGAVVLPILYVAGGVLTLFALLLGIMTGMSKSSQLVFDAERFELQVRQVYTMTRLLKQLKKTGKTGDTVPKNTFEEYPNVSHN